MKKKAEILVRVNEVFLVHNCIHFYLDNLPTNFVIQGDVDLRGIGLLKMPDLSTITINGDFYIDEKFMHLTELFPKKILGQTNIHPVITEQIMHKAG